MRYGDWQYVDNGFRYMTNVNERGPLGRTMAHILCLKRRNRELKHFLSFNPSLEEYDHEGLTPLLLAARDGNIAACRDLLAAGASPRAGVRATKDANEITIGRTSLHFAVCRASVFLSTTWRFSPGSADGAVGSQLVQYCWLWVLKHCKPAEQGSIRLLELLLPHLVPPDVDTTTADDTERSDANSVTSEATLTKPNRAPVSEVRGVGTGRRPKQIDPCSLP